jgi:hypothetical protein
MRNKTYTREDIVQAFKQQIVNKAKELFDVDHEIVIYYEEEEVPEDFNFAIHSEYSKSEDKVTTYIDMTDVKETRKKLISSGEYDSRESIERSILVNEIFTMVAAYASTFLVRNLIEGLKQNNEHLKITPSGFTQLSKAYGVVFAGSMLQLPIEQTKDHFNSHMAKVSDNEEVRSLVNVLSKKLVSSQVMDHMDMNQLFTGLFGNMHDMKLSPNQVSGN